MPNRNTTRYSDKFSDEQYSFRYVVLSAFVYETLRIKGWRHKILQEDEWRNELGLCMSPGWVHIGNLQQEAHVLIFRRDVNVTPT